MNITKSKCRKRGWLHRYRILQEHKKSEYVVVEEMCEICKHRIFIKADLQGRIDNVDYLRSHIRQALPKYIKLYQHEFGK